MCRGKEVTKFDLNPGGINPPTSALQNQVNGDHYSRMKIQPAEFITKNGIGFLEGNVIKYISRHKSKNKSEDILKAIHYCQLILELEYEYESLHEVQNRKAEE